MQVDTLTNEMLRSWTLGEQAHLTALVTHYEARAEAEGRELESQAYRALAARCRKAIDALANG